MCYTVNWNISNTNAMKKANLQVDEVRKLYQELKCLNKVVKALNTSKPTLCRFMDENKIERKQLNAFYVSKEQLLSDYERLNNIAKIAEKYQVGKSVVKRLFKEHGIPVNKKQDPNRFVSEIKVLSDKGLNSFEIAKKLNISPSYLNEIARDNGITLKRRFHKGYIITHNGYKKILDKSNKDSDAKGYVHEHRRVLSKALNLDSIPEGYVVHHINGDKLDNSPGNLEMMTLSEHSKLHKHQRDIV